MYRIFIADDNELARQALKKSIEWKLLDCELCGEATNGNEALEMIEKQLPDIVLMDIKMPGITGMEVIAKLGNLDHDIVYIMVTAYNDFEFMRRGMQIGVFDYILKPVSDDELQTVLQKAVNHLKQLGKEAEVTKNFQEKYQQVENTLENTKEELEEKLFHDAINGIENSAERFAELLKKRCPFHDYLLILVIPEVSISSAELGNFIETQKSILEECQKNFAVYMKGIWRKEGYLIFVNFKQSMFRKEYDILSLRIAEQIQQKNEEKEILIYCTISRTSSTLSEIDQLFSQTLFCKNGRFFLENKSIIHYDSLRSSSVSGEYVKMKKLEELYEACREEKENITASMEAFLNQFSQNEIVDINYVKNIMIQAVIMLVYIVRELHPDNHDFESVNDYIKELSQIDSLQETYSWMFDFAEKIQNCVKSENHISSQTRRILDYMNLHYSEQITLQDVAEYMGLSGTHVSRLLKKEIGETFITCLNKIRIKESVRLLKSGQYKVYEIAEMTGYSNYAYFYQIFKKSMGVSPKDYV